ncbi:MAG: MFS transporter, partial [Candidatus Dormibacteria bacterium]
PEPNGYADIVSIGFGLTLALFVVYFAEVRHFPEIVAGALLSWQAVITLITTPVMGTLIDRYGPSRMLVLALPFSGVAYVLYAVTSSIPEAIGVVCLMATAQTAIWSSFNVLLARIVHEDVRQEAFGLSFMILNLGIALGSLVGPSYVNIQHLSTFQLMYLSNGVLMLVGAVLFATLWNMGQSAKQTEGDSTSVPAGWRDVLKDRRLLRFLVCATLLLICGYGSLEAGIPLYVTQVLHHPVSNVGILFFFNTVTIIIAQIFVLGKIQGKSRSLLLGGVGIFWGMSWFLATASVLFSAVGAIASLCIGQIVFGLGETIWAPVGPALVNDLAPEELRGRYNSVSSLVFALGGMVGPVIATLFIQAHLGVLWSVVVGTGAIVGGAFATTLKKALTPHQDGRVPHEVMPLPEFLPPPQLLD